MRDKQASVKVSLVTCVAVAFVGWTGWVIAMATIQAPFDGPLLRGLFRVAIVMVPALLFTRLVDDRPWGQILGLRQRPIRSGISGILVGLIIAAPAVWRIAVNGPGFQPLMEPATWLNGIIGSPIAEELLFRGVVARVLINRLGLFQGILFSSILFAAFHLPVWLLLEERAVSAIFMDLGILTVYGALFAGLFHAHKNICSPIVAHITNNLLVTSMG